MLTTGDVYEVVTTQSYLGSTLLNVFHVQLRAPLATAQASFQTLADDFKEAQRLAQFASLTYSTWKATQVAGAGITYSTTTCRRTGGDVYEGNHTGTLFGATSAGIASASFNAMVTALKSGLAGRSRRGQVYTGGWGSTAYDSSNNDRFSAALLTSMTGQWTTFFNKYKLTGGTSPDFVWVIWSKFIASGCKYVPASPKWIYTHVQPGDQANSATNVTSFTPRALVVPMRRRKEGRGI
jgi:hypothetical protein